MNSIIEYINRTYSPTSLIVYGSYADGTNNENSDFDALVISGSHENFHDTSFVDGIRLDVFVYPETYIDSAPDPDEFLQIFDGKVIVDSGDRAAQLKNRVCEYIDSLPTKTPDEIKNLVEWCGKMRRRASRRDAEGLFRWHWLLTDSLEIFCDIKKQRYFGPKKTLKWMQQTNPEAYEYYMKALSEFNLDALDDWIMYLVKISR